MLLQIDDFYWVQANKIERAGIWDGELNLMLCGTIRSVNEKYLYDLCSELKLDYEEIVKEINKQKEKDNV